MDQFQIPFYAGLLSLILFDGEVSDKASEENYLFGSQKNADNISDILGLSLIPFMIYSSTLTNTPLKGDQTNFGQKSKLIGFQSLILLTDFFVVGLLKNSSGRLRPDKSDLQSLPSGHSSISAGLSRAIYNNVENSKYKNTAYGKFLQISAVTIAGIVAYARVEALKHHLSDVFLGHAIGAFISDFMYKSFLDSKTDFNTSLFVNEDRQGIQLTYHF